MITTILKTTTTTTTTTILAGNDFIDKLLYLQLYFVLVQTYNNNSKNNKNNINNKINNINNNNIKKYKIRTTTKIKKQK